MKKKTIKIFYSWQDDIDNKSNRYFIKDCLDISIGKMNKAMALEEADRLNIKLDHDTKDIPGIPEIANTILQKISISDIFIADLTFVSEYKNYKQVTKKISNQNVIFELGFAFNILGPQKIICVFNTAFGEPKDLLFDLQHRRWPITYELLKTNSIKRKSQKEILVQKLDSAISSIVNKVPFRKGKTSIHNPFSIDQHNDFEYLYSKLNIDVQVFIQYQEMRKNFTEYDSQIKPYQYKNYSCQFMPALVTFIEKGNNWFDLYEFHKFLELQLSFENLIPKRSDYYSEIEYNDSEMELLLRTLGLISLNGNRFYKKIYLFIHWLEYNGYKNVEIKFKEL
jgi:hypothetical protein